MIATKFLFWWGGGGGATNSVNNPTYLYLAPRPLAMWEEDINREHAFQGNGKNKLRTYSLFKSEYATEQYLSYFIPRLHRSAYAKFCCGVAPIHLETGRYERIPLESRIRFVCPDSVESEEHGYLNARFITI